MAESESSEVSVEKKPPPKKTEFDLFRMTDLRNLSESLMSPAGCDVHSLEVAPQTDSRMRTVRRVRQQSDRSNC